MRRTVAGAPALPRRGGARASPAGSARRRPTKAGRRLGDLGLQGDGGSFEPVIIGPPYRSICRFKGCATWHRRRVSEQITKPATPEGIEPAAPAMLARFMDHVASFA